MVNLQDFIIDSTLFKTIEVEDFLVVEYRCLVEDHEADIWTHHNYFAYVIGGEKKWKTPFEECKVASGDGLFVRKGVHTVYQYFKEPFYVIFVFLTDDSIRNILLKYPHLTTPSTKRCGEHKSLYKLSMHVGLESTFKTLLNYFSLKKAAIKDVLKLKLEELILHVLHSPEDTGLKNYFINLGSGSAESFKRTMNENYCKPLSVADYAKLCGRSISSFKRDFQHLYGQTPGKWLLKKRLEYSRFLLETTDMQVAEIIDQSGFINRSHFNRRFKSIYRHPPLKYRKVVRESLK